jgi:hypothetical protein
METEVLQEEWNRVWTSHEPNSCGRKYNGQFDSTFAMTRE